MRVRMGRCVVCSHCRFDIFDFELVFCFCMVWYKGACLTDEILTVISLMTRV